MTTDSGKGTRTNPLTKAREYYVDTIERLEAKLAQVEAERDRYREQCAEANKVINVACQEFCGQGYNARFTNQLISYDRKYDAIAAALAGDGGGEGENGD